MNTTSSHSDQVPGVGRWSPAIAVRMLPRSNFARSVATVASASAVAQSLLVVASPLITRLYGPTDLGVFTVFASLLSILTVPACGRFEQAIVLSEDDDEAVGILIVSIAALLTTVCMVVLYLCYFAGTAATITGTRNLPWYLWLLPPCLLSSGVSQALSCWTIRTKKFSVLGKSKLAQSIVQILAQLSLAFALPGPGGLVLGTLVGRLGGAFSMLRGASRSFSFPGMATLVRLAKRYKRFPLLSAPASLFSTFAQHLPALIVASIFGPLTAGLFALVQSLVSIPVNIISSAVGQVYFSESARIGFNRMGQQRLFWSVLRKMLLIGSPLLLGAIFDFSQVIGFVFGAHWKESAAYLPPLVVFCYAGLVVTPLGSILDVFERQDLHLVREISRIVIMSLVGATAAVYASTPLATVQLLCAAGIASHLIYACISLWVIQTIPHRN